MDEEILHYEVTNSYGEIKKGQRFDVHMKTTEHPDIFIKEGLSEATGVPVNKINLSMLKCVKI
jgi:hypothetical protein